MGPGPPPAGPLRHPNLRYFKYSIGPAQSAILIVKNIFLTRAPPAGETDKPCLTAPGLL